MTGCCLSLCMMDELGFDDDDDDDDDDHEMVAWIDQQDGLYDHDMHRGDSPAGPVESFAITDLLVTSLLVLIICFL